MVKWFGRPKRWRVYDYRELERAEGDLPTRGEAAVQSRLAISNRQLRLVASPTWMDYTGADYIRSVLLRFPSDYLLVDIESWSESLLDEFQPKWKYAQHTGLLPFSPDAVERIWRLYKDRQKGRELFLFGAFSAENLDQVQQWAEADKLFVPGKVSFEGLDTLTDYYLECSVDMNCVVVVCNRESFFEVMVETAREFEPA